MTVELTTEQVSALIAALNFTKHRTKGRSWIAVDEEVLNLLTDLNDRRGLHDH